MNKLVRVKLFLALGAMLGVSSLSAQEVRFSQFEAAPLLLNPATPGTVAHPTLGINYRLQQLGIISYKTGYFSALLPVYPSGADYDDLPAGGVGLGVMHDLAGEQNELRTYQLDLSGAYNLRLNAAQTHYLSLGLQASFLQTNVDYGALTWPSQITYRGFEGPPPALAPYADRVEALRFNAGLHWTYDPMRNAWPRPAHYRIHLGASVANLNRPDYSFLNDGSLVLTEVYRIYGGAEFRTSARLSVSPGFFVISQGGQTQYAGGGTVAIHLTPEAASYSADDLRLRVGSWYRYDDALVLLIGGRSSRVDAALSYDLSTAAERSGIKNQNTVELSLAYRFLRSQSPQAIPNPLF